MGKYKVKYIRPKGDILIETVEADSIEHARYVFEMEHQALGMVEGIWEVKDDDATEYDGDSRNGG